MSNPCGSLVPVKVVDVELRVAEAQQDLIIKKKLFVDEYYEQTKEYVEYYNSKNWFYKWMKVEQVEKYVKLPPIEEVYEDLYKLPLNWYCETSSERDCLYNKGKNLKRLSNMVNIATEEVIYLSSDDVKLII